MANTKSIKTRIQNKHAVEADWIQAKNFIPLEGEIIIYDPDEKHTLPRIKVGDGKSKVNELDFITDNLLPMTLDPKDNSYHIDKPLKIKTDNVNSYFINTEGEASLAIIGYADEDNDSEARLVLGNKNKVNFAIRDQVMNSKDAVLNFWDYNYDKGNTIFRLEPVNVFKQKAFNNKTNQSGAYVASAVWPTDGTKPANYHELPLRLSKVVHEDNVEEYIDKYAITKADGGIITDASLTVTNGADDKVNISSIGVELSDLGSIQIGAVVDGGSSPVVINKDEIHIHETGPYGTIVNAQGITAYGANGEGVRIENSVNIDGDYESKITLDCAKITDACVSCGTCAENCPVEAITEGATQFEINADLCVDCGACLANCPTDAIEAE